MLGSQWYGQRSSNISHYNESDWIIQSHPSSHAQDTSLPSSRDTISISDLGGLWLARNRSIRIEESVGLSVPPDPRGRSGNSTVNIWTNRLIESDLVLKGADVYRVNQTLVPTSWAKPDSLARNSSRKALHVRCVHRKNANLRNWKCWFLLGEINVTNISIKA